MIPPPDRLEVKKVLTGRQAAELSALNLFARRSCLLDHRVGYFDLGGQRVILAEAGFAQWPKLRAMQWRTERRFRSKSYKLHGDCSGMVWFAALRFIPGTNDLLGVACRQLLLFDATTLELKKSLIDEVQLFPPSPVAISGDGSKIAVARKGRIAILNRSTWEIQGQWAIAGPLSGLGLSADGMALAWLIQQPGDCVLHGRWLSSSPEPSKISRSTKRHCLESGSVVLLPLESDTNQIAVPFGDSPADFGMQIWDLRDYRIVREYAFKLATPRSPFFWEARYSPDLKYAFVGVNSPEYSQDLVVLHVDSGQVVYEGERASGQLNNCMPPDIVYPWPGYQPTLELSEDGRFLLTTLGQTYEVFELNRKQ